MLLVQYRKLVTPFYRKLIHKSNLRSKRLQINKILIKCRNYSANPVKNEAELKINVESLKTSKIQTLNEKKKTTHSLNDYGAALYSYVNEKILSGPSYANLHAKLLSEYNKIVSAYNNDSSKTESTSTNIKKTSSTNIKINIHHQNLNLKEKTSFLNSNMPNGVTQEKLSNLCNGIEKASSNLLKSSLITDLFKILYESDSDIRHLISKTQTNLISTLLKLRKIAKEKDEKLLYGNINECLSLLGHVDPHPNHGVNILSLDGGGAKGFVTIEILKNIEKQCGKPIHEIFDYICGVSTGAVLACLIGMYKMPLDECERNYKLFISEIFQRNKAAGIGNLLMSYSYYDTQCWEKKLKEIMGDTLMVNSAKDEKHCKISVVSNVTTPNQMKIFLFRNYNLPTTAQSHYDGTTRFKVWEAIRASSAAPFYYEDFKIDGYVFHDGGLLANNPTVIALHESKHLWPNSKNNCIVSIGNGRFKPAGYASSKASSISLRQKITRVISGISCTENVHTMLLELLPSRSYFRFNPYMSEEFQLDEDRPIKWKIMQYETNMYMRRNEYKFKMLTRQLLKPKSKCLIAKNYLMNIFNPH